MDLLSYFLVSVIAYSGLFAGNVLMQVAPEERKPGMKYFNAIQYLIFIVVELILVFFLREIFPMMVAILFAALLFVMPKYKMYISYGLFAIVFFLLVNLTDLFLVTSLLVFAYGMAAGSAIADKWRKDFVKLAYLSYFVLIANLLMIAL